jgi:hypothetical protein
MDADTILDIAMKASAEEAAEFVMLIKQAKTEHDFAADIKAAVAARIARLQALAAILE